MNLLCKVIKYILYKFVKESLFIITTKVNYFILKGFLFIIECNKYFKNDFFYKL